MTATRATVPPWPCAADPPGRGGLPAGPVRTLVRLVLLPLLLSLAAPWAIAGPAAQQRAEQFYAWYMARIVADDPPLLDKALAGLRPYVSARRLARIQLQMNSADGMSADYFMQSQDYLDSWPRHISVTLPAAEPKRPRLKVVLGVGTEAQHLAVRMVKEGGAWKVDEVGPWPK